jgi:hypothetical protein
MNNQFNNNQLFQLLLALTANKFYNELDNEELKKSVILSNKDTDELISIIEELRKK